MATTSSLWNVSLSYGMFSTDEKWAACPLSTLETALNNTAYVPSGATVTKVILKVEASWFCGGGSQSNGYIRYGFGGTGSISKELLAKTSIQGGANEDNVYEYPSNGVDITTYLSNKSAQSVALTRSYGEYLTFCFQSPNNLNKRYHVKSVVLDIEYHTHSYTSSVTKAATCTAAGVRTYTCSCKDSYTETIAQLSHSYTGAIKSDGNGKDATHSFKCVNGCNNYGGAVKHTWNSGSVTKQPTCTATGTKTFTCTASGCGATYTETLAKNAHTEVAIPAKAATCTDTGLTEGKKCSVCGTITVAQQTVPAKGHTWVAATCTAPKTCSVCGATEGSALGHSYTDTVVQPTTSTHGYTRHTCSRCGHYYDDSYTYLVRWYNEDGSKLLETDPSVPYGEMPSCSVKPTKAATAQYTYTHIGWAVSPTADNTTDLTPVVANIDYYARFRKDAIQYTVTWKNYDNEVLETDTSVPYGTMPDYDEAKSGIPTRPSTAQYDFTFLGWSAEVFEEEYREEENLPTVTGNIVYTAVYLPVVRKYNLDIVAYDCTVDGAVNGTYDYGTEFNITVDPDFGYKFVRIIDVEYGTEYTDDELTFILTGDTTLHCVCERLPAPLFTSSEQQVKDVYIVPAINTIVYIVEGNLPTLTTTMHTVDDLHFDVINTDIDSSKYADYMYYPIEQWYVNDKYGNRTRIW